jgi:vitamin B12 transporter
MKRPFSLLLAAALAAGTPAGPVARLRAEAPSAAAEETAAAPDSDPVFLSVTRQADRLSRMPTNVSVLTAEEIRESGGKTLADVLDRVVSADVTRAGGLGSFATVRLRGVPSSAHVQVVVDDRPVGGASLQFADLSQIPADDIERVEVVRGGSSVLYGANTVGGVVHVITKRQKEEGSRSSIGYESRSFKTQVYRGDFGVRANGFDGYVNASRYFTDGFQQNEDGENMSVAGNGGYSFANGARVSLDLSRSDNDIGDPQGTLLPPEQWDGSRERTAANVSQRIEQDINAGRLYAAVPLGPAVVETTFFGSDQDYRVLPAKGASPTTDQDNRVLGGDARVRFPWGSLLGGSYERDVRFSAGSPNLHVTDWGLYAQQTVAWGRLDLIPAFRFDQHGAFGNVHNPRFTAVLRLSDAWKLSANASRSFRAPTLVQLYEDFPAFKFFGNRQLRPETAWTYDFGVQYRSGEAMDLSVTGFHTRLRERITGADTDGDGLDDTNVNAPRAETSGAEVESVGRWGPFTERVNYTYLRAVGNSPASAAYLPLRLTPRHLVNYELTWRFRPAWRITNAVRYVHRQYQSDGETGLVLPGHTVWSARLTRRVLAAEVYFAADNIANARYAEGFGFHPVSFATTYLPQPRRTFWGGITIRFRD